MGHAPNENGNCRECGQLRTRWGLRVIEPFPCPVVRVARLSLEVTQLREQVAILSAPDAMRTGELREENEHLRRCLARAEARLRDHDESLEAMFRGLAVACLDRFEKARA